MSEAQNTILARAEIPDFALTRPPVEAPSREDFLIAEMERRFGGRAVWREEPRRAEIPVEPEDVSREAEPEWADYGFRGQVGKLLWARGLRKKAIRFVSCNKCARPGLCSRYPDEHKYFVPNGCEVVFCKECADEVRRELLFAYQTVILAAIVALGGLPEGWVLARVNFTLRSDGSEITPERVKKFRQFPNSVSVGFRPLDKPKFITSEETGAVTGYEFTSQELLELSAVPIPANPEAVARAVNCG